MSSTFALPPRAGILAVVRYRGRTYQDGEIVAVAKRRVCVRLSLKNGKDKELWLYPATELPRMKAHPSFGSGDKRARVVKLTNAGLRLALVFRDMAAVEVITISNALDALIAQGLPKVPNIDVRTLGSAGRRPSKNISTEGDEGEP